MAPEAGDVASHSQLLSGLAECGSIPLDRAEDPVFLEDQITLYVPLGRKTLPFRDERVVVTGGVGRWSNILRTRWRTRVANPTRACGSAGRSNASGGGSCASAGRACVGWVGGLSSVGALPQGEWSLGCSSGSVPGCIRLRRVWDSPV